MHLSDANLRRFADQSLPASELLAADDHLAECGECRGRLAGLGGANVRLVELETDLVGLEAHLSDEDVQTCARGDFSPGERPELERHLHRCPTCAEEVRDLRSFIAKRPPRPRPNYLVAAAAVLLALLGAFAAARWFSDPSNAALASLPADVRGRVEEALRAGVAESTEPLAQPTQTLMGATEQPPFRLLQPLGTATVSDRPEFRWETLAGADRYEIAVLDRERLEVAAQANVARTTWTPSEPLARGRTYAWQVTAHRSGESVTVPAPPSPVATFRVMDARDAGAIERLSREQPDSHLVLGILYALSGARVEAESHLSRVRPGDPHFETAQRTLERLRK
jgi:anti-sigma factor RsiW